jgi:hypothetical protein
MVWNASTQQTPFTAGSFQTSTSTHVHNPPTGPSPRPETAGLAKLDSPLRRSPAPELIDQQR